MTENSLKNTPKLGGLSLLPPCFFLLIYIGAGLWFNSQGQLMAFHQFPAPSCALFGFGLALALGYRHVGEHISVFVKGIGDDTVILMCLIFLLTGAFSALTKATGSVDATVNLGLYILADRLLLPGIFLIACFISFSMGTSMGTISTMIPIAIGISQSCGLSLPLVAGTVIGGAMFGDNLSVISDTTIAATGTQGCSMKEKMAVNIKIALPAALIVFIGLFFIGESHPQASNGSFSLVRIMPYALVLLLAVRGTNVILVLMLGILASIVLGLSLGSFHIFAIGKIIYDGFLSMADVFFVTFLIAGLAALAAREGGLDYLVRKISPWARGRRSAEAVLATCVSLADICVANNTVAILLSGPAAKKIAAHHQIAPARAASLLDVFSCVWQGLLPYGSQLLLAGGLCQLSGLAILPYSFYPFTLGIVAIVDIIISDRKHG